MGRVPWPGAFVQHAGVGPLASAQTRLRRQVSAGSTFRAGSPDPAPPSSLREPGTQHPAGPQPPQAPQTGLGPTDCEPG